MNIIIYYGEDLNYCKVLHNIGGTAGDGDVDDCISDLGRHRIHSSRYTFLQW